MPYKVQLVGGPGHGRIITVSFKPTAARLSVVVDGKRHYYNSETGAYIT